MSQKYPRGLHFLFMTEMWERFSFYGISAILVLYLTKGLGLPDKEAALASGAYMAFTFMTPILGGFVADKVLGLRYSVTLGGVFILIGNLVLAIGGLAQGLGASGAPIEAGGAAAAARNGALWSVFVGLACVAIGTGYLKSTVSVMVGKLYKEGDTHRDSGYTLFYMGINIGALLAGLLMGYVAEKFGWTKGFYMSSAGMLLGLVTFYLGYPYYNNEADGFKSENLFKRFLGAPSLIWIVAGTLALGALMVYLFQHSGQTKQVVTWLSMAIIAGMVFLAFSCKEIKERNSILAILIIIVAAICFQSLFKQLYNSMPLFVDRDFDRILFGEKLSASFFALVPNSLAVIILAGLFTWFWARLADVGRNPSIPMKIVIALCFAVASSALLAFVAKGIAANGIKASAWWVVLGIVILTFGELNILPMGLSAVSALAPKRYASLLMGSWFLCNSLGGYFSGFLTSLANVEKERAGEVAYTASVYFGLYWKCSAALAGIAVIMLLITPFVKKLMAAR